MKTPPVATQSYRCEACTYGISVIDPSLVRYPICGASSWVPEQRRSTLAEK